MTVTTRFAPLLERFFTQRLMTQRCVSPNTIASYRDTFCLLLRFAQQQLKKEPANIALSDIDAPFVSAFLDDLEKSRGVTARSRNLRLTAIRSFFRYTAYYQPAQGEQIQRVLAIPSKRQDQPLVCFLSRVEVDALLTAPNLSVWHGRRDHALLWVACQTGLRASEITGLRCSDLELGPGAHLRCKGKGRKERCTPLTTQTVNVLKAWLKEPVRGDLEYLFPTVHGSRMSADAVQYLVIKHIAVAQLKCPSLKNKQVSPHVMRHTAAMRLLEAGVDVSVIALWLGHESIKTTQLYLDAHLALKEAALAKTEPFNGKVNRFRPDDDLLQFLKNL